MRSFRNVRRPSNLIFKWNRKKYFEPRQAIYISIIKRYSSNKLTQPFKLRPPNNRRKIEWRKGLTSTIKSGSYVQSPNSFENEKQVQKCEDQNKSVSYRSQTLSKEEKSINSLKTCSDYNYEIQPQIQHLNKNDS